MLVREGVGKMENQDDFLQALKDLIKQTRLDELEELKEPIEKIKLEIKEQEEKNNSEKGVL